MTHPDLIRGVVGEWHDRAEKAEAEVARLRELLAELRPVEAACVERIVTADGREFECVGVVRAKTCSVFLEHGEHRIWQVVRGLTGG